MSIYVLETSPEVRNFLTTLAKRKKFKLALVEESKLTYLQETGQDPFMGVGLSGTYFYRGYHSRADVVRGLKKVTLEEFTKHLLEL